MDETIDVRADIGTILEKVEGCINGLIRLVPNLVAAAVLLVVFYILARLLGYAVTRTLARRGAPGACQCRRRALPLDSHDPRVSASGDHCSSHPPPRRLLSGLEIGSVAIGFAFKDILQNLLSGVLILLRQAFRVRDQIAVSGFEGMVEDIETRATYIKTYDGRRVVIPNSQIYTGTFTVNTAFELRRSEYDIGIGSSDDWGKAMQLLTGAARGCEGVLADPPPEAIPVGIDAYQNTIRLRWWTKPDRASVIHAQGRVIVAA